MEETAYNYRAALHPKTFILDTVELRPLCLGHLLTLETVHSPFLSPVPVKTNYEQTAIHYTTALLICGLTWEDNEILVNDDALFNETLNEFSQHIITNAVRPNPNWNLDTRSRHFQLGYMDYYINSMPILDPIDLNSTPSQNVSGMDWKTIIKTLFTTKFGYDESKILNMSLRQLYYEWAAYAEMNGVGKVRTAVEQTTKETGAKQAEEFRRQMKELAEQRKAKLC